jgi:prepilin signal peptidase PulO-like enzyme (type II secretory pathway)
MGLGDPKLVLGIGWFLGPVLGLSAVILAFWIGAGYGLILMALSKFHWHGIEIDRKTEVPFAPFLILGFLLVFFFSFDILGLSFLLP